MILADHALPRCDSRDEHGGDFVLQHLADGNAGPGGDDFAHNLRVHADAHQRRFALKRVEFGFSVPVRRATLPDPAWRRRRGGCAAEPFAPAPLSRLARAGCALQLAAHLADAVDQIALLLPTRLSELQPARFLGSFILGDLRQPLGVIRADGRFALEHALLHLQIVDAAA